MKKTYLLAVMAFLVAGCGSDSSDSEKDPIDNDSNSPVLGEAIGDFSALAGVYSFGDPRNERYLVIHDSGKMSDYDYDGDSLGDGVNCYKVNKDYMNLQQMTETRFRYAFPEDFEQQFYIDLIESGVVYTYSTEGQPDAGFSLDRTSLLVTDLAPLCEG